MSKNKKKPSKQNQTKNIYQNHVEKQGKNHQKCRKTSKILKRKKQKMSKIIKILSNSEKSYRKKK